MPFDPFAQQAGLAMSGEHTEAVGRGHPPTSTRFVKGQSGNPNGRPKGARKQGPYETVLGQMVTVREEGLTRQMTAAEAFVLHVTRKGLEGDSGAAHAAMAAIGEARQRRAPTPGQLASKIVYAVVTPGSVNRAMLTLRMAVKHDAYRPTARVKLRPWVVEAALARMGSRRLDIEQQQTVWQATQTPWKVQWPTWWTYREGRKVTP